MVISMELDFEKRDWIQYGVIAIVLFLLALYTASLFLDIRISQSFSLFYIMQNILAIAVIPLLIIFNWKVGQIVEIPAAYKAIVTVVWIGFIVAISLPGVQQALNYADCSGDVCVSRPIIKIPNAVVENYQIDSSTQTMTTSVIPAIDEDANYLLILPIFLMVLMVFLGDAIWNVTGSHLIVFALIACFISASIFTGAHSPSYGNNQQAYTGAFVYSFGQSAVYVFTGWFLPIAHFMHNYIVNFSRSTSLSIGGNPLI